MNRATPNQLVDNLGQVQITGWLHKKRKLGGLNFLLIHDRDDTAQMLVKDDKEMAAKGLVTLSGVLNKLVSQANED